MLFISDNRKTNNLLHFRHLGNHKSKLDATSKNLGISIMIFKWDFLEQDWYCTSIHALDIMHRWLTIKIVTMHRWLTVKYSNVIVNKQ